MQNKAAQKKKKEEKTVDYWNYLAASYVMNTDAWLSIDFDQCVAYYRQSESSAFMPKELLAKNNCEVICIKKQLQEKLSNDAKSIISFILNTPDAELKKLGVASEKYGKIHLKRVKGYFRPILGTTRTLKAVREIKSYLRKISKF